MSLGALVTAHPRFLVAHASPHPPRDLLAQAMWLNPENAIAQRWRDVTSKPDAVLWQVGAGPFTPQQQVPERRERRWTLKADPARVCGLLRFTQVELTRSRGPGHENLTLTLPAKPPKPVTQSPKPKPSQVS